MSYLAKFKIIHGDLTRKNVFLQFEENNISNKKPYYRAKVGNFGHSLSKNVDKDAYRIFTNGFVRDLLYF
jgi:hypothetical protein